MVYAKAVPGTTYDQLERSFRLHSFNTYLIAYVSGSCVTRFHVQHTDRGGCV